MEFNSSIEGMMHAQKQLDLRAQNIAQKTATGDGDISEDIIGQKQSKFEFEANARVAKVQDRMLGEVVDLIG